MTHPTSQSASNIRSCRHWVMLAGRFSSAKLFQPTLYSISHVCRPFFCYSCAATVAVGLFGHHSSRVVYNSLGVQPELEGNPERVEIWRFCSLSVESQWLDSNLGADEDELVAKLKEVEAVANPIISRYAEKHCLCFVYSVTDPSCGSHLFGEYGSRSVRGSVRGYIRCGTRRNEVPSKAPPGQIR